MMLVVGSMYVVFFYFGECTVFNVDKFFYWGDYVVELDY